MTKHVTSENGYGFSTVCHLSLNITAFNMSKIDATSRKVADKLSEAPELAHRFHGDNVALSMVSCSLLFVLLPLLMGFLLTYMLCVHLVNLDLFFNEKNLNGEQFL